MTARLAGRPAAAAISPRGQRIVVGLLVLALAVVVLGAWRNLWQRAAEPESFFGGDHVAYRAGAERLIAAGSPYDTSLMAGPIANRIENVGIAYLYPPPIAQVFAPVRLVDPILLGWVAVAVQAGLLLALGPLVYRRYGGGTSVLEILGVWLLLSSSWPVNFALFGGNLSGWLMILVAIMLLSDGLVAGVSAALAALMKFTPLVLLLPALAWKRTRPGALVALIVVVGVSLVLSPGAWRGWIEALPNILRFPTGDSSTNFAPAALLGELGYGSVGSAISYLAAAGFALGAIWLGHLGRWPGAVAAGVAAILYGSGSTWDHYLAPTIPLVIAAFPRASWRVRGVLAMFALIGLVMWLRADALSDLARVMFLFAAFGTSLATTVTLAQQGAVWRADVPGGDPIPELRPQDPRLRP